jgi:hypothetical protein
LQVKHHRIEKMESPLSSSKLYQRVSKDDRYDGSSINDNITSTSDPHNIHQLGLKEIMEQKKQQQLRGSTNASISTMSASLMMSPNENEKVENDNLFLFASSSDDDEDDEKYETSSLVDDPGQQQRQRRRSHHHNHHHSNDTSVANNTGTNSFRHKSFSKNQQDRTINSSDINNNPSRNNINQQVHSRIVESVGSTAISTGISTSGVSNKIIQPRYQDNPLSVSSAIMTGNTVSNEHQTQSGDDQSAGSALKSTTSPKVNSPLHPPRNILRTLHNENNNFVDENSRSLSNINSNVNDADWELDDDEDIEPGLRRYNQYYLEYAKPADIPMPAEFTSPNNISDLVRSIANKLWAHFIELRTNARQRRAARLLTMPSESWRYQLHACLLTWFCDATDAGILLLVSCLMLWILLGIILDVSSKWWTWGILLFIIRITARRMYEILFHRHLQNNYGSSSASTSQNRSGFICSFPGLMSRIWLLILGKANVVNRSRVPTREADSISGNVTQSSVSIMSRYAS